MTASLCGLPAPQPSTFARPRLKAMCLQLRSRRAEAACGRAHDRRRLSRPRIVAVGSRCPVNRVLEHSRDRITASDSRMRRLRTGAEAAGDAKDVDGLPHLVSLLAVACPGD